MTVTFGPFRPGRTLSVKFTNHVGTVEPAWIVMATDMATTLTALARIINEECEETVVTVEDDALVVSESAARRGICVWEVTS